MILDAFHEKITTEKTGYLPGFVDPQQQNPTIQKTQQKSNAPGNGLPPARPPERGVQGAQLPGKKKKGRMSIGIHAPR